MVERTQVNFEVRDWKTPLHWAADNGRLPVVRCLREQGIDKEARSEYDR